jgi:organic hydroperoxide reductase OsmC/OhrA
MTGTLTQSLRTPARSSRTRANHNHFMAAEHHYELTLTWTGNQGTGTSAYRSYARDHEVTAEGKPSLPGSSDPSFRGDPSRWNPEELLVASLSQCHMLWYLHLCATNGVTVTDYRDTSVGTMTMNPDGSGQFTEVRLHPHVTVATPDMIAKATELHNEVHNFCFITRSVNFPVHPHPIVSS